MKDFHKTHPSGSGTVTKTAPSVTKIKSSATSEEIGVKPWLPNVTEKESSEKDDDEDETKITDKGEGNEDEEIIYTTSQLYDNVDIRLNEPVDTDEGFVQEEELQHYKKKLLNSKRTILSKHKTALVNEHLDARIGATRDEFMNFILASITARITKQVKNQILPKEVSDFAPSVIQDMVTESLELAVLAKEYSQPQSLYEATATLTKFELKKILIDKIDKMYSLKRSRKDKDKDEDPSAGSDRGLNKRKTNKNAKPAIEELEFEFADSDMPHDQEKNQDNNDEPKKKVASKRDWFTKPTQPQEPTDPDWNIGKTPKQGQNQSYQNRRDLPIHISLDSVEVLRLPSSSVAASAGVSTSEGTTDETGGDFRNHSGDAGFPTGDGRVWAGAQTRGSQVPQYLFREGRVDDDAMDDDDKGVSKGVNTEEPQAPPVGKMVSVSVEAGGKDIDL
nr:hypothetical protein [Tanacetum cinerariifolium]